tara:strand:- start:1122 stop:1547 length:426 start_codon:yes stop_codon:yes gene_type:complete
MSDVVTLRGVGTVPNVERVLLFAGDFTRAYRILDFQIAPTNPLASEEISAAVNTIEVSHTSTWNWALNTQVAWAAWNVPINSRFGQYSNVDDEALIVEDLHIDFSGDTDQTINWELKLERLTVKEYEGALAMIAARGQGSD